MRDDGGKQDQVIQIFHHVLHDGCARAFHPWNEAYRFALLMEHGAGH